MGYFNAGPAFWMRPNMTPLPIGRSPAPRTTPALPKKSPTAAQNSKPPHIDRIAEYFLKHMLFRQIRAILISLLGLTTSRPLDFLAAFAGNL